ncbi:hypothetical protein QYE76_041638 [Lolium multiflorum]|uniref:Integrase catalytic domain-containing protein n=1 Tax=Lolium multiflorum TaxID=4521 RepID=A0AAD8WU64_LOLMU|nr:hypothetical protein QYE76_041638 [Lolium multiflorum]
MPEEAMLVDSMDIDMPVFVVREAPSWVKPIKEFLANGTLPVDENKSRRIQRRSKAYTIINGEAYKRSVTGVLQRCVEPEEGREMLEEIHRGECLVKGAGGKSVPAWILLANGFGKCGRYGKKMQWVPRYAKQNHTPSGLKTIPLTLVWCLDMVGPFKTARGNMTHILVMVDKFTKWLEVKPIAKCDGHTAVKFPKDVILRYGYPHSIIDNGTNFAQGEFKRFCEDKNIRLDLCSVAHPQGNGQVERTNALEQVIRQQGLPGESAGIRSWRWHVLAFIFLLLAQIIFDIFGGDEGAHVGILRDVVQLRIPEQRCERESVRTGGESTATPGSLQHLLTGRDEGEGFRHRFTRPKGLEKLGGYFRDVGKVPIHERMWEIRALRATK